MTRFRRMTSALSLLSLVVAAFMPAAASAAPQWGTSVATGPTAPQTAPTTRASDKAGAAPRSEQQRFIETIAAAAKPSAEKTGVPVSVTIAQAILESGWGRSSLTKDANNLFGVKAHKGEQQVTMPTLEFLDGSGTPQRLDEPFRAYASLAESIRDHNELLTRARRYLPALTVAYNPRAFARAIHEAGYSTDPQYADKLISLMKSYNLGKYDVVIASV